MELKETIDMMNSENYEERFKAEYYQLKIRYEKLGTMLGKYLNNELTFTPNCGYNLLHSQLVYMEGYLNILEIRAKLECIDLK